MSKTKKTEARRGYQTVRRHRGKPVPRPEWAEQVATRAMWPEFSAFQVALAKTYGVEADFFVSPAGDYLLAMKKWLQNGEWRRTTIPWPATTGEIIIAEGSAKVIARLMCRLAGDYED